MPVASVTQTLIGASDFEAWEAVRCDRSAMAAIGGGVAILGTLPGEEAFGPHEPGDAVAPTGTTEHSRQARTAIGLAAARELLPDAGS